MGAEHFLTKGLRNVGTEMSLEVLYGAIDGVTMSSAYQSSEHEFNLATRQMGLFRRQPTHLLGFFPVFPRSVPKAEVGVNLQLLAQAT